MARAGRPLPLFLAGLLLFVVGGAWASIDTGAYLPRFVLLAGGLLLAGSLVRHAGELRLLLLQARSFSEPGPTTTLLLVAIVLGLSALLSARLLVPLDLTAERLNSLSSASRAALKALPGTVRLQGFYADPSPQWERARRYFELYARSSQRVETELTDPERDPAAARAAGVARSDVIVISLGGARTEVQELGEEAITQGILRVLEGRPSGVGFLQGHGEPAPGAGGDEGLSAWSEALRAENVEVRGVSLMEGDGMPEGIAALALVHPRHPLYPHEARIIQRYVETGGRLGLWLEPGDSTGLEPFLDRAYVRFATGTIRDEGRVTSGIGLGPWVVALVGDPHHPVTAGLGAFAVSPGARPVAIVSPHPADLTAAPILKTTGPVEVYADPGRTGAGPLQRGIMSVAAVAQWTVPVGAGWKSSPDLQGLPPLKPEARILVCGDASLVTNRFLGQGSNRDLALSAIHWLASQERFLDIARERTRPAELRVGAPGLRTLLYLVEFGLPLAFVVLGTWVWMKRRAG